MSGRDFSNWMSELPPQITSQPLNHLAIPGTHDSFTHSISKHSPAAPDAPIYKIVSKLPHVIGGSMMCNWTVTQDLCIQKQLEAGIRYLDFRVGVKNFSGSPNKYEFYLVHGQCANTLAEELQNVAEFLQDHPREVVLIDCNHCYEFKTPEQTSDLENLVLKMLGAYMMPTRDTVPSLDEMWAADCQVIFFVNLCRPNPVEPDKLWPTRRVKSLWPEKSKAADLLTYLETHYG
ncbi:PI-PLC X domain-containing protein 3 [Fasciola hepatica]|uniref:PI-PLC X domain-containing protein 3 n=1 Tax=Fasciola hepatica TaxID=6192 RepID=A0A4E0RQ28_FASHE|nr:PI-PLC X domain-containing protein 3 [Fasciola hepatica]